MIAVLIFLAIFTVIAALLLVGDKGRESSQKKQTVAVLEAALGTKNVTIKRAEEVEFRKNDTRSAIPWLNTLLTGVVIGPRLTLLLNQAAVRWTAGKLLLLSFGAFGVSGYLIYLRTGSFVLSLLAGAAAGLLPAGYVLFCRMQRFGKFEKGLAETLELMVGALRVGHSFNSVLGLVTRECQDPISTEFRIVFDEQNYGLDIRTALTNLCTRMPLQDLRIAVTAILIQRESGGNLAEVLEKTAHVIRERFRLKKQVMVHTAQGRLTGLILAILPLGLGFALYLANPDIMSVLWKTSIGVKLLYAGAGMITVGTLIIQKIVRVEV